MEAFILGCGGMMPLPRRALTSVLLRRERDLFLFDCGEGTQLSIRSLRLRWKKISTVFISHTHADHVTGLPGLFMLSSQVEREKPLTVVGPPNIKEYIDLSRKALDMYINYDIEVREIANPQRPSLVYEDKGFCIRSFPLRHSRTCVGYTLEEAERPGIFDPEKALALEIPFGPERKTLQAGKSIELADGRRIEPHQVVGAKREGRKFSFVTDTLYFEGIAPQVAGSDLLVCEGMFDESFKESAKQKKHLTALQAGRIARAAGGIGKMALIHYSPRYGDECLKKLLSEAKSLFSPTVLSRDRMHIKIPPRE